MEHAMHHLLVNFIGPLMLPVLMLCLLCMIGGARPEPIITGLIGLLSDLLRFAFQLIQAVLVALIGRGRRW